MDLNFEQLKAVKHIDGPLLILAGAGSGKTKVVTTRIANLLKSGIDPLEILALTFTNKAAKEMKDRVNRLTNVHVFVSTFHSLGARILRESISALGYSSNFVIYDEEDTEKILRHCLVEIGEKEKKGDLKVIRNLISQVKNNLLDPLDVDATKRLISSHNFFPELYRCYVSRLKECNAVDFDDLLYLPVRLFQEVPAVLERYQRRWHYLLIDEYQDTNHAQYTLVQLLVEKSQNLFVVGDPDQSIYSWRGADIHNILNFERDYPGAEVIRLEQNYRSTCTILEAANHLISHNRQRYEKKLWSALGEGAKIARFSGYDEREESRFVARRVRKHAEDSDIPYHQMAVFYRTNAQSRAFEDQFLALRLPYVIVGGISFYQRKEIKDILAFLRLLQSKSDFVAFVRAIHLPKRGIGDASLEKLVAHAQEENLSILEYATALVEKKPLTKPLKLPAKATEGLKGFVEMMQKLEELKFQVKLKDLVKGVIEGTGYLQYLQVEERETMEERKENLDELIAKAAEWEETAEDPSFEAFLEELSLKSSLDEAEGDRVQLMTIHNGKGLEFAVVFLAGMEEDLFPHANSRDNEDALEEERRLCYVGMTRAKSQLYLTYSQLRYIWGNLRYQRPSRFLSEIPSDLIVKVSF